ncbi:Na+/H+ antiporter NhaC family protein [Vallitalea guaymasensis]|uniref:Na+/H+ antiporter NhaC family protein n=1 Tax=Vallitalea guaymasensis TaxID=1185412 RepID=UPI0023544B2A|nr:Na+/H+ antiporter NhaC family protein [Vallitalea guaymasensis]
MNNNKDNSNSNFKGLLPLIVFLVLFMGTGIITGDFSSMPLLVAFIFASGFALLLDKKGGKTSFGEKVAIFTRAGGEETIILMVVIFILAGAFYSVADAMGAVNSIVNLGLTVLPVNMILPGIFIIGCILSFSMGTSMGTITALAPIGVGIANQADISMALVLATVVGSAMFGDNLSFISDTTIAATRTQNVELRDKFKSNILIVLPAVIITLIILAMIPVDVVSLESVDYSLINILPYVAIIVSALIGLNVMAVLGIGIGVGSIIGLINNSFDGVGLLGVLQRGMGWMEDLSMIAIVVAGLVGLMKYYGGIDYLLEKVTAKVKGKKGGQFGIAALVGLITAATTNNTISILTAGPLAKDISEEYDIDPRKTASLLDIFSAAVQGLIPYGGQLLLAAGLGHISPVEIVPYSIYSILMLIIGSISIIIGFPRYKRAKK